MRRIRSAVALLRLVLHLLHGHWLVTHGWHKRDAAQRRATIEGWMRRTLRLVGVELRVTGAVPLHGPLLLVANHISWLDIVVVMAVVNCRFVSKAEVHQWPIVGKLAYEARTLFIERESRRDAMRVVHHMAEALAAGDLLAIFPEGTTSDGTGLLPFHANLLQAAIAAQAPVQPLAITYRDAATGQRSDAANYVGDDSLLSSMWRLLNAPPTVADVRLGQATATSHQNRRALAAQAQAQVQTLREVA